MATRQTPWADGRETAPRPQTAGAVHCAKFVAEFNAGGNLGAVADGDVIEIGQLQPFATIVDAILVPEGTYTSTTVKAGLMTGTAGDGVSARTCGAEIFAASTALTGTVRNTLAAGFHIAPVGYPRGIGIQFDAAVTAASNKRVTLLVFYIQ